MSIELDIHKPTASLLNGAPKSATDSAQLAEMPKTVIEPPQRWQLINAKELWQYRELLGFLTWRDVKVRYKQTLLGASWAILQPAMMMIVFTVFFGRMAQVPTGDVPYPLFVYAGLLPWTFFATAIANAGNSVVGSERLITKIYFPRLTIPFASVGAAVVDFCCAMSLMALLMIWYGVAPGLNLFAVPLIFGLIAIAALGVGTLLAALNVAYRDFRYVIPFLVQIWMFATPTVYMQPDSDLGWMQTVLSLNPLTSLVGAFRDAMLGNELAWSEIAIAGAAAVAMFIFGCLYFRKVEDSFADII
jgi:homopolymeric O-antigen transport system permease protein